MAFVTLLFGFIEFSIDDLLGVNGAVFSSVLAIAAAFIVYYINKNKEEEKDNKKTHNFPNRFMATSGSFNASKNYKKEISYIAFYQNILYNAIMETIEGRYDTYEKENHCALAGGFDDFFAFRLRQKGSRRQVLAFRRYNDRGKGQRCKNHPVRGEADKAR